jgi:hypothetical protein
VTASDDTTADRVPRGDVNARGPVRRHVQPRLRCRQRPDVAHGHDGIAPHRRRTRRGNLLRRPGGHCRRVTGARRACPMRRGDRPGCRHRPRPCRHDRPGRPGRCTARGGDGNGNGRRRRERGRRDGLDRVGIRGGSRGARRRGEAGRRDARARGRCDGRCDLRRRGSRRRRVRGGRARGQEPARIHVPLRVGRQADAEVDVRHRDLGVSTRADRGHRIALGDGGARADEHRTEVRERDGVAVGRGDRDAPPGGGHDAREGDGPARRGDHRRAELVCDVDATVVPRRIRMRRIEAERLHDVAARRPRPRGGGGHEAERGQHGRQKQASHRHLRVENELVVRTANVPTTVGAGSSARQAN